MGRASVYGDAVAEGQRASALYLPGVSGNNVSCPDSSGVSLTGDIDVRVCLSAASWGSQLTLADKLGSTGNRSWQLVKLISGNLNWYVSTDGKALVTTHSYGTTLFLSSLASFSTKWIRVTFDADSGAGQHETKFYTSDDGLSWVQYGITRTGVSAFPFDGNSAVTLGASIPGGGKLHRFELRNGIDGPIVASWDGRIPATRQRDPQGNIWTVNGTANGWVTA